MNVTLKQLRAFMAVARTGSFTVAAERLFVTQPALSGLIKELENTLGLVLIDRSTRKIELSEKGRDFFPLLEKILHDLDTVLEDVANLKALKQGRVRIAAPQLMACTLLPEVIAAYRALHSDIQIHLTDCVVDSVISKVFSGEVDFGIGPERAPNSDIAVTPLFELPFMAVFPCGHALEKLPKIGWADLIKFPFISLKGQFTEHLSGELHAALRNLTLAPSNEVAFMSTALSMVNAGLGVTTCMPYAASQVQLYQLEMRPLFEPIVMRRFSIYARQGRSLSPAARSFMDFLIHYEKLAQFDWSQKQKIHVKAKTP